MTSKQLGVMIGVTVLLALVLAWTIERAQVRRFMVEFDKWWEEKSGGRTE